MNHPGDAAHSAPKHEKVESFSAAELRKKTQHTTPPQPESYYDAEDDPHYTGIIRLGSAASQYNFNTSAPISREKPLERTFSGGQASVASERHIHNEDATFVDIVSRSAGVFDGVGADSSSNLASEAARSIFRERLASIPATLSPRNIRDYLREIAQKASDEVTAKAGSASTTGVAAIFREDEQGNEYIAWISAGDSRLYLFDTAGDREHTLTPLTLDHAWYLELAYPNNPIAQMNYQRTVAEMESRKGLNDHIIINSLGRKYDADRVTTGALMLSGGEKFMLFSDGVTDNLRDSEIAKLLQQATEEDIDNQQTADRIVERARQVSIGEKSDAFGTDGISGRAKVDDISAVVITG